MTTSQRYTLKQLAIRAIGQLPEDATADDVIEQVRFVAEVMAGIDDADAGHLISVEELEDEMKTWFE